MINIVFLLGLAALLFATLVWGIRTLPSERWQMIAAVPVAKTVDGAWKGINFTFYGFFSASANIFGVALMIVLSSSVGTPLIATLVLIASVMVICVPASRVVAKVIEGKPNTFTIAGAAFVAAVVLPPAVLLVQQVLRSWFNISIYVLPLLAAASISYALSESLGRLACLSFGCCYGVPVRDAGPRLARLFRRYNLVFHGNTKKAAYASGFAEEPLIPVQPITSIVFALAGLIGLGAFLAGHFRLASILPAVATWGWRALSESLRADYRGASRISAYQVMAFIAAAYLVLMLGLLPNERPLPSLLAGFTQAASTLVVILLQVCWVLLFLYYGRSRVTASTVSFHVVQGRI
jgi:succinate dehydrogenase/fumarate reductase cytochrome b subunit